MKKLTALLIMIFLTGISFAFADKSRFYKNDKLLDVMYILPDVIKTSILENAKKSFDEYQKTLNIGSKEK